MRFLAALAVALLLCVSAEDPAQAQGPPSQPQTSPQAKPDVPLADRTDDVSLMSPRRVEEKALEHLAAGRQSQAERLLQAYALRFPEILRVVTDPARWRVGTERLKVELKPYRDQQRALFLLAACTRSRFAIAEVYPWLVVVNNIDPDTPAGKCAAMVAILDNAHDAGLMERWRANKVFSILTRFPDAYPDDVVIRWMAAVECRHYGVNEEGVRHYKKILEKWKPAPVLVHQTYANLLDDLGRYSEALPERQKAVEMEPRGWSYDGLATTLYGLKRYEEACQAHAKAVESDPTCVLFLRKWALTLKDQGRFDESIEKCQRAAELDWRDAGTWWVWGSCLETQNKKAEALEKYQKAVEAKPAFLEALKRIEALKKELGKE